MLDRHVYILAPQKSGHKDGRLTMPVVMESATVTFHPVGAGQPAYVIITNRSGKELRLDADAFWALAAFMRDYIVKADAEERSGYAEEQRRYLDRKEQESEAHASGNYR